MLYMFCSHKMLLKTAQLMGQAIAILNLIQGTPFDHRPRDN